MILRARSHVIAVALACALFAPRALAAPPGAETESAAALRDQGNDAMLAMRYSDALGFYQRALAVAPEQAGLHYSLARAHQFLAAYPEALTELEIFAKAASPQDLARVGSLAPLFAELRPRVSVLNLRSNIAGARVILRDRVVGTTPVRALRVAAGACTVQVELDGFFPEKRDIVLPAAGSLTLDVDLQKRSQSTLLLVTTTPIGAQVFLDGRPVGTTNPRVELAVPAGPHELEAKREGYDAARVPIVLAANATREIAIPLEKSVPLSSRWWFWTGIGVLVAGGAVAAVALTTEQSPSRGTLGNGQVAAP